MMGQCPTMTITRKATDRLSDNNNQFILLLLDLSRTRRGHPISLLPYNKEFPHKTPCLQQGILFSVLILLVLPWNSNSTALVLHFFSILTVLSQWILIGQSHGSQLNIRAFCISPISHADLNLLLGDNAFLYQQPLCVLKIVTRQYWSLIIEK